MSEKIQIQNFPDGLEENMVKFANSICQVDIDPSNFNYPRTLRAEFIKWPDSPEYWAGAWARTHVLACVKDHTNIYPALKPRHIRDAEIKHYAMTCTYCLPSKYRQQYEKVVTVNGRKCLNSTLTNVELTELDELMSDEEKSEWGQKVSDHIANSKLDDTTYTTFEKPIRIYLAGTDDTSYSLTCATADEAMACLDRIKSKPSWGALKAAGFVFSN